MYMDSAIRTSSVWRRGLRLPRYSTFSFWIGSIAVVVLTGLYTILGGLRAVAYTDTLQTIIFIIGSALFALGSAPGFASAAGATASNLCYFVGAWFFTGAALVQLVRSGPMMTPVDYDPGKMFRAEWLAGSTQFFGTLLFNVSTTAALMAHTVKGEQHLVWNPDAGGSVAFLLSGGRCQIVEATLSLSRRSKASLGV